MNYQNIKTVLLFLFLSIGLYGCGSDVGGNEDKISPSVALTSLNDGEEVVGAYKITWSTDDPNPSSVDIYLSSDSGEAFPTVVALNVPDAGEYDWDTNTVTDCRTCRIRIIPHDVVGNEGVPAESMQDFIVNNVPQVLGAAFYTDVNGDGLRNGDMIRVPFDKEINLLTSIASDIFVLPVLGDSIGSFAEVARNTLNPKELIITMNDIGNSNFHLHIGSVFKTDKLGLTAPSGINLRNNISDGIIFAPDTGRTAAAAELGIDILPGFADSMQDLEVAGSSLGKSVALGDIDGDGDLDMVVGFYAQPNIVWLNGGDNSGSNTGVYADSGQALGNNLTVSVALGDVDGDGDLDMVEGNRFGEPNKVWLNGGDGSGSNTGVFSDSGQELGAEDTLLVALADVDGDGDLDMAVGDNVSNKPISIWLNTGINTGVFIETSQVLNAGGDHLFVLGDVDGDGDLDIVIGNQGPPDTIWLNGGDNSGSNTGVFIDSGQALGNNSTRSLTLGDVDGDGDLDMVAGNDYYEPNIVWLNGGDNSGSNTGVFAGSGQELGSSRTTFN